MTSPADLGFWAWFVFIGAGGIGVGVGLIIGAAIARWLRHFIRSEINGKTPDD